MSAIRELINLFPVPSHLYDLDPSFEFTNSLEYKIEKKKPYARIESVEEYMYFAAINSKSCRLTALGNHYWKLAKDKRI